jgi:hypothetical protein
VMPPDKLAERPSVAFTRLLDELLIALQVHTQSIE